MILDGRDRYTAAKAVRHKFTRQLRSVGRHLAEAEAWVISTNFHRRQLTTKQKQEMIEGMIRRNPDLSDREIARQIGVSNSTVWRSEGLVNSPEVQRYRKFKAQWERFSDAECAVFVRDHLKDTKYLVAEAEKSNGQNPKTLREFWAVRVEC